ncbi:hypothetical protein EUTSA_v10015164mg [Eutrema salsugineum]|uniref:Knottin scorpion toxin-like domain-containing protein n=1 Tax=Eutrema salsugineum TaxID=72664 RepID=V4LDH0_EUTSA|nr:hypothetical protein EUTSA_v10015164mg [Eutrema salsugineum]
MVLLLVSNGLSKANGQTYCFADEGDSTKCTTAGVNGACDTYCKTVNAIWIGRCEGSPVHCHCYKPC